MTSFIIRKTGYVNHYRYSQVDTVREMDIHASNKKTALEGEEYIPTGEDVQVCTAHMTTNEGKIGHWTEPSLISKNLYQVSVGGHWKKKKDNKSLKTETGIFLSGIAYYFQLDREPKSW